MAVVKYDFIKDKQGEPIRNKRGDNVMGIFVDGKLFKPVLFPSEKPDIDKLIYPLLASEKRDGHRCLITPLGMKTREWNDEPNRNVRDRWKDLVKLCARMKIILDGEMDDESLNIGEVSSILNSFDKPLSPGMNIYLFDVFSLDNPDELFLMRMKKATSIAYQYGLVVVIQKEMQDSVDVEEYFDDYTSKGGEGLILRSPNSIYKFNRYTLRDAMGYKLKLTETFDAKIIGVQQGTIKREGVSAEYTSMGRASTGRRKEDRVLVDKAGAFIVDFGGTNQEVMIAMTDEDKKILPGEENLPKSEQDVRISYRYQSKLKDYWVNQDIYIGKWISFKGMTVGKKEKIRHPVLVRFRHDRDGILS